MKYLLILVATLIFGCATVTPQERMKDCNTKAGAMKGDERKAFMSKCLKA